MRRAIALAGFLLLPSSAGAQMLEHPVNVVDYTLRATLDPIAHTVHGEGTILWRNTSTVNVSELWVHLYLNAFKNEKSVFLTDPVGQFRGGGLPKDWGYIDVRKFAFQGVDLWPKAERGEDETDMRVPLPREAMPNELVPIEVVFDAKLPTVLERTGYEGSFHMVGQWFPKIARLEPEGRWAHFPFHHLAEFYADFGTYDVTLDVPEAFTIGATGPATDARVENGRRIERHVQSDVHDFAWTAWDQFEKRMEKIGDVDVTILYPRGYRVDAERELATMRFALPHYGERYGPYPYPVLTLVHPPSEAHEAGGMEYPTLITTGAPWYGPPGVMAPEGVTIHEFGHQYFYGLIASDEVTWPFLDEGLNTFAEQEGLGAWLGAGSAIDLFGLRVSDAAVQAVYSRRLAHKEPVAQPAFSFLTGRTYGGLVYGRTATLLETMRRVYGKDRMMSAFGRYTRAQRFRHPVPDDLFDELGTIEPGVRDNLKIAFFDRGWVDFQVETIFNRKVHAPAGVFDDGERKTVGASTGETGEWEGYALVLRKGTISFPVEIELVHENGWRERRPWDGREHFVRVPYRGDSPVVFAVVDPDRNVLVDDEYANNWASAEDARGSTNRSFERLTYWGELAATLLGP